MERVFAQLIECSHIKQLRNLLKKKLVNIQGVSEKANPKKMDDVFEIKIKLVKIPSKTEKLTSYFF